MSFNIGFYWISGVMLGVEIQRQPDGPEVLVVDLLILRVMFFIDRDEQA